MWGDPQENYRHILLEIYKKNELSISSNGYQCDYDSTEELNIRFREAPSLSWADHICSWTISPKFLVLEAITRCGDIVLITTIDAKDRF